MDGSIVLVATDDDYVGLPYPGQWKFYIGRDGLPRVVGSDGVVMIFKPYTELPPQK